MINNSPVERVQSFELLGVLLLYYYKTVIGPVTEYTCAVWHSSITAEQRDQLKVIQWRAVCIIRTLSREASP